MQKKLCFFLFAALMIFSLTACSSGGDEATTDSANGSSATNQSQPTQDGGGDFTADTATELIVQFGDSGEQFTMMLEDNDTAAAIAGYVGSADWRLPIYHYDDFEGWEFMQYYDIPSRYDIPSNPTTVTEGKAGEVYYSEPNRIILFYHDGEVNGEYTKVGEFDVTDEFVAAVEENPVLEGWGNKIVVISAAE